MNARPYVLLSGSTLRGAAASADAALQRWAAAWLPGACCSVQCGAAEDSPPWTALEGIARHDTAAGPVWSQMPRSLVNTLGRALFGDAGGLAPADSPLARRVLDDALHALAAELVSALCGQVMAATAPAAHHPDARLMCRGSGALLCTVKLGDASLALLLPHALLPAAPRRAAGPSAPVTALHPALAKTPVPLDVELGSTELTLGYLRTLAVGDVLALPIALDRPLRVTVPGGATLCHGHIGKADGHRAIELHNQPLKPHWPHPQEPA